MAKGDGLAQLLRVKISGKGPQAEAFHAAVNRVRPEVQGGAQGFRRPGRRQEFRDVH